MFLKSLAGLIICAGLAIESIGLSTGATIIRHSGRLYERNGYIQRKYQFSTLSEAVSRKCSAIYGYQHYKISFLDLLEASPTTRITIFSRIHHQSSQESSCVAPFWCVSLFVVKCFFLILCLEYLQILLLQCIFVLVLVLVVICYCYLFFIFCPWYQLMHVTVTE